MKFIIVLCSLGLFFSACKTTQIDIVTGKVILVRHAERDEGVDALNDVGHRRAEKLVGMVKAEDIQAIYCSQFLRTQQTAQPTADALGLDLIIYDAFDLAALVETIKKNHKRQTVLVVGHSNTVPDTVNAFGMDPSVEHLDHSEYSKMFMLEYGNRTELSIKTF